MSECYLNARPPIVIRRTAAIGDVVSCLPIARRLMEQGHPVVFQSAPAIHPVLNLGGIGNLEVSNGSTCDVNMDGCYEQEPNRKVLSFARMFTHAANAQLSDIGLSAGGHLNYVPEMTRIYTNPPLRFGKLTNHPRPWVFVCPRSQHYPGRTVPDGVWTAAARHIEGTKFWIGLHPAPPGFLDFKLTTIPQLLDAIGAADLLVTVDTGPMHLAAAMGIPVVALGQASSPDLHLSDQRDFITIWPDGLGCLNCQLNICPVDPNLPPCQRFDPEKVAAAVNSRLQSITGDGVSAVIAVYRPEVHVLNKCLDSVIPQVDEVIVVRDLAGDIPRGSRQHPKVKYITKQESDLGYGRKANYGARHANHRWLFFCNDDVYLEPDAVRKLMEARTKLTGIVCGKLTYPSGKLYPVVKLRMKSGTDMNFPDVNRYDPFIPQKAELEACSGCAILVRRSAFYQAQGFDERFYLYCEDDDLCMKIRRAGYQIIWTPESLGIHDEHRSTVNMPNRFKIMEESGRLYHSLWDWYFEKNKNNSLGTFV